MTSSPPRHAASHAESPTRRAPRPVAGRVHGRASKTLVVAAASAAFALTAIFSVAPPPTPIAAKAATASLSAHAQTLTVSSGATIASTKHGVYTATAGVETLASSATNYDWAKLVLISGKWPTSVANVTVLTRWMRQENGPNNWWNRNNPLNNGWGSGGNAGTGSYVSLVVAAQQAADALTRNSGYSAIKAAFATSAPMNVTEKAIWASPWSTSHYMNGTHWSSVVVPVFTAPASAW